MQVTVYTWISSGSYCIWMKEVIVLSGVIPHLVNILTNCWKDLSLGRPFTGMGMVDSVNAHLVRYSCYI